MLLRSIKKEVFNGEVTTVALDLQQDIPSLFHVTALTYLQRLNHGTHTRVFEKKTASQAVKDILSKYNIQADCDSFGTKKDFWKGGECSALTLITRLAKQYGKDILTFGNKVYVKEQMTHKTDEIIYEWGKSLLSFDANVQQLGELRRTDAPAAFIEIGSMDTNSSRAAMNNRMSTSASVLASAIKDFYIERPNQ